MCPSALANASASWSPRCEFNGASRYAERFPERALFRIKNNHENRRLDQYWFRSNRQIRSKRMRPSFATHRSFSKGQAVAAFAVGRTKVNAAPKPGLFSARNRPS
jgi:hypothetical protein